MRMQVTALALDDVYGTDKSTSKSNSMIGTVEWTPGIVEERAKERNTDYDGGQLVSTSTS
jgi:hypothetical protein